ncbi:MAG TPA: sigma 54-interacting transcriptional regulator, partial [Burkholderiaceae bacterium]
VKLLRAIQERRVRKLGATAEEAVDVRIISATHQHLAACVERGAFRQDLYYRLNVIELALPPLRERSDDIAMLASLILDRLAGGAASAVLSSQALQALKAYSFPGNVRELENILERAVAFAGGGVIEVADLALKGIGGNGAAPPELVCREPELEPEAAQIGHAAEAASANPVPPIAADLLPALPCDLPRYLDAMEREIMRRALEKTRYNRTQAADLLGISFRQLRYRMQRLGIHEPD